MISVCEKQSTCFLHFGSFIVICVFTLYNIKNTGQCLRQPVFIKIVIKKAAPMDFFPESTPEENDDFAKGLGVAYFLPLIEWIVTKNILDVNESVSGCFLLLIGVFAVVISLIANKSYGSPLYMLAGYHFHTIQTENSKSYVLMSKKKHFRNRTQVYRVIRLFEDLLIDVT